MIKKKFSGSSKNFRKSTSATSGRGGDSNAANWIWGLHSVEACLECFPESILEIQVEGNADFSSLQNALRQSGLEVSKVAHLPKLLSEKRTQGVAARLKGFPGRELKEYLEELTPLLETPLEGDKPSQWAVLDGIQDPRNFGAILRSAAAFGVQAIFIRDRNQAPLNGVVAQASAGNMFRIPVVTCVNFSSLVELFRDNAHVILGLEAGARDMESALKEHRQHRLWILGGEGSGIREGLREKCNALVSIPMAEGVESLNASAAATLAFYLARNN